MKDAAKQYIARAWHVLPVGRDKKPLTKHGVKNASADPAKIETWFQSNANIGIAAGKSGLFILDVDGEEGRKSLRALEKEHGPLPDTVKVATPRGGYHYYFKRPGDFGSPTKFRPGLDIRCDGTYVLAPPSVNASGKTYEWVTGHAPDDIALADAPEWLLKVARGPKQASQYDRALAASLRLRVNKKDGSRRLFAICCRGVSFDLSRDEIIELVREVEKEKPFPKSYSDDEIDKRIGSAEGKVERGCELITKPRMACTAIDLDVSGNRLWSIVKDANDPPFLYRCGERICRIEPDDNDLPVIRQTGIDELRYELARIAYFYKVNSNGVELPCTPPKDLVANIIATPNQPLPKLRRVVTAPVFSESGVLLTTRGYHPESRTFFSPAAGFELPPVAASPTVDQVAQARNLIFETFGEFPFIAESEKATAIAFLLLPFARNLIVGPTPLHVFEKPAAGTGASLLVSGMHYVVTGSPAGMLSDIRGEDEWRKKITSKLREAPEFFIVDNVKEPLESAALCAALTSTFFEDRQLATNVIWKLPIHATFAITGNNPILSGEIARRSIRCRLDAKVDQPFLRSGFKIEDLLGHIKAHRASLVHSCLVLIRSWIAAGMPAGKRNLGMYENWSRIMGGILANAEIPGFLDNLSDFYSDSDTAEAEWRAFLRVWHGTHGNGEVKSNDLYDLMTADAKVDLGSGTDLALRTRFGKLLAENRDRVFNLELNDKESVTVQVALAGQRQRANVWKLMTTAHSFLAV